MRLFSYFKIAVGSLLASSAGLQLGAVEHQPHAHHQHGEASPKSAAHENAILKLRQEDAILGRRWFSRKELADILGKKEARHLIKSGAMKRRSNPDFPGRAQFALAETHEHGSSSEDRDSKKAQGEKRREESAKGDGKVEPKQAGGAQDVLSKVHDGVAEVRDEMAKVFSAVGSFFVHSGSEQAEKFTPKDPEHTKQLAQTFKHAKKNTIQLLQKKASPVVAPKAAARQQSDEEPESTMPAKTRDSARPKPEAPEQSDEENEPTTQAKAEESARPTAEELEQSDEETQSTTQAKAEESARPKPEALEQSDEETESTTQAKAEESARPIAEALEQSDEETGSTTPPKAEKRGMPIAEVPEHSETEYESTTPAKAEKSAMPIAEVPEHSETEHESTTPAKAHKRTSPSVVTRRQAKKHAGSSARVAYSQALKASRKRFKKWKAAAAEAKEMQPAAEARAQSNSSMDRIRLPDTQLIMQKPLTAIKSLNETLAQLKAHLAQKASESTAAVRAQKAKYEANLTSIKRNISDIRHANHKLELQVRSINAANAELRKEATALQEGSIALQGSLKALLENITTAQEFLTDSLNASEKGEKKLSVLRNLEADEAAEREDMAHKTALYTVAHSSLLQMSAQAATAVHSTDAADYLAELGNGLDDLSREEESSEDSLKAHFEEAYAVEQQRLKEAMDAQAELKMRRHAATKLRESLEKAVAHLKKTVSYLKQRVVSVQGYAMRLGQQ